MTQEEKLRIARALADQGIGVPIDELAEAAEGFEPLLEPGGLLSPLLA